MNIETIKIDLMQRLLTIDSEDILLEIEKILDINCAPVTLPIGAGKRFKGVYNLLSDEIHLYTPGMGDRLKLKFATLLFIL